MTTPKTAFGQTVHHVEPADWLATATAHHADGYVMFDWLGVEDAGRPGAAGQRHAVLLHVIDPRTREGVMLRTELGPEEALPGIGHLWKGAQWHQREASEMFGVTFGVTADGEPEHLLLPDSFQGHPLRKDFVLASRVVRPWPGALEPGEDNTSAPSRRRTAPPGVPDPSWGPRREEEPQS
ncbi:NADH-quinone oxidoreductase subunit C [Lentzea flaviverrucosa]|uniref:NADH-quinone oxidoreductase subunit C n=1 Tax=Lentzea flaviverrucosa TaxID=200379 RepID=A0A1H9NVZ6_9PSEU|nr:NADH-quinone oxidoreductase subunit C [Lentzea flaviverrucosa]RDI30071.1 NADH dehydrogenase subunit C [Lentzea flaviverrucosa]SER39967.1 NADH-quinone oxidoreductase subunit C [Lentzea flaviverrucosa]